MPKAAKENILIDIRIELEKGTGRSAILTLIVEKWPMSKRTFDRYYKIAYQRHTDAQQETQRQLEELSTSTAMARGQAAILSKDEALELLSEIASGLFEKTVDKVSAIKTMAELQGWKAPIKQQIETSFSILNVDPIGDNNTPKNDKSDHSTA